MVVLNYVFLNWCSTKHTLVFSVLWIMFTEWQDVSSLYKPVWYNCQQTQRRGPARMWEVHPALLQSLRIPCPTVRRGRVWAPTSHDLPWCNSNNLRVQSGELPGSREWWQSTSLDLGRKAQSVRGAQGKYKDVVHPPPKKSEFSTKEFSTKMTGLEKNQCRGWGENTKGLEETTEKNTNRRGEIEKGTW